MMVWLVTVLLIVVVWTFVAREAALWRQIEKLTVQLAEIEEQPGRDRETIRRLGLKLSALQHRSEAVDANICRIEARIGDEPREQATVAKFMRPVKAVVG